MNCDSIRDRFILLLYGELSFDEEELVERHLESCEACRAELELRRKLGRLVACEALEPPEELLLRCRRGLRANVAAAPERSAALSGWVMRAAGAFRRLRALASWAVLKPAGALALVMLGFFSARLAFPPAVRAPAEPIATRVRYIQSAPGARVRMLVDETRQRVISGSLDDQRILRALLAAARDPEDAGLRAESVDLLKSRAGSREVRGALLQVLRRDPNPGVRLRALEALRPYSSEPDSRLALVDALLADDNPGIRTQAADLLAQHKDISVVPAFQSSLERERNSDVRFRLLSALREMNASTETF